jgi:hypothetical protein
MISIASDRQHPLTFWQHVKCGVSFDHLIKTRSDNTPFPHSTIRQFGQHQLLVHSTSWPGTPNKRSWMLTHVHKYCCKWWVSKIWALFIKINHFVITMIIWLPHINDFLHHLNYRVPTCTPYVNLLERCGRMKHFQQVKSWWPKMWQSKASDWKL